MCFPASFQKFCLFLLRHFVHYIPALISTPWTFSEYWPIPLINFILGPIVLPWPALRLIFLSALSRLFSLFVYLVLLYNCVLHRT